VPIRVAGDARRSGDDDAVVRAWLAEHLLRGCVLDRHQARSWKTVDVAVPGCADEGEVAGSALAEHCDRVTDDPALVGCCRGVHDDLSRANRGTAGGELQRAQSLGQPVRADRGAEALDGAHLSIRQHELGEALHRSGGRGHAGHAADVVDDGRRDAFARLGELTVDSHRLLHDDVDAVVGGREQAVERARHRVGEHSRTGHERHAEHDGEPGEREAQLVGPQALQRETEHRRYLPRCFM
jgi:hypothetical protein